MAGVTVSEGGSGGRRALDSDINMIPMIDLLMVTIAFLLVTAVWSQMSRIEGSTRVPGPDPGVDPPVQAKVLHVDARPADRFVLSWRQGNVVVSSTDVARQPGALAQAIGKEWHTSGQHTSPADALHDEAVVHVADGAPFAEMVAVMDAVEATKRPLVRGQGPAFVLTLATQ